MANEIQYVNEQPIDYSTVPTAPPYREQQRADVIRYQLDPKDILDLLENTLRGRVWDESNGEYTNSEFMKPMLNEEGVNRIMNVIIRPRVNKGTYLTNLDTNDINRIMYRILVETATTLFMNYQDYNMKKDNLDLAVGLVDDLIFFALNRAVEEGERKFLGGTLDIRHLITNTEMPVKRGFFGIGKNIGGRQ